MARKSVMIPFDTAAFRDVVRARGRALSDLEAVTGVTKQAMNGWLTASRIPPRQLYSIAQKLDWTPTEVGLVLKKDSAHTIRFRSHAHTLPTPKAGETALRLATDFFTLDALEGDYPRESLVFRVSEDSHPAAVAEAVLKQLGLKRGQFGLDELVQALNRVSISVIFVDFGELFSVDVKGEKGLKAFCAKRRDKYLICVDSRLKIEDVVWVIFHELAHIVYGDLDREDKARTEDDKAQEKVRSEVANEVLTPTELIQASREMLEKFLNCEFRLLPARLEHLASQLGASFGGVLLALKKFGLLTPQKQNYLWKVWHRRQEVQLAVKDLVGFQSAKSRKDLLDRWDQRMNTEELQKFIKLHLLVRQGLIEEKLSVARAAELLGIDAGEMEELANHWAAEVSDEVVD